MLNLIVCLIAIVRLIKNGRGSRGHSCPKKGILFNISFDDHRAATHSSRLKTGCRWFA